MCSMMLLKKIDTFSIHLHTHLTCKPTNVFIYANRAHTLNAWHHKNDDKNKNKNEKHIFVIQLRSCFCKHTQTQSYLYTKFSKDVSKCVQIIVALDDVFDITNLIQRMQNNGADWHTHTHFVRI